MENGVNEAENFKSVAVPQAGLQAPRKTLSPEAQRALAEAQERRRTLEEAQSRPVEINGRGGLDPIRYGDWEVKGLTSDF